MFVWSNWYNNPYVSNCFTVESGVNGPWLCAVRVCGLRTCPPPQNFMLFQKVGLGSVLYQNVRHQLQLIFWGVVQSYKPACLHRNWHLRHHI